MIGWVRFAGDLVAVLGFATALVFLFLVPTRRGPSGNAVAKWVLAGAFGLEPYVLSAQSTDKMVNEVIADAAATAAYSGR